MLYSRDEQRVVPSLTVTPSQNTMVSAPPPKDAPKDANKDAKDAGAAGSKDKIKEEKPARTLDSIRTAPPKKQTDQAIDVVDDEFEDFPAEEWEGQEEEKEQQWEDSWADEDEAQEDFAKLLKAEHGKVGGAQPMKF